MFDWSKLLAAAQGRTDRVAEHLQFLIQVCSGREPDKIPLDDLTEEEAQRLRRLAARAEMAYPQLQGKLLPLVDKYLSI
jgi:hypothetical protein